MNGPTRYHPTIGRDPKETSPADRLTLRPPSWRRGSPWDLEIVQGMAVTGLTWEEAEKLHRLLGEALAERNAQ